MRGSVSIMSKSRAEGKIAKTSFDQQVIEFKKQCSRMVMKDVPAFKSEAFMTTEDNYLSRIEFELATINIPGNPIENYTDTWESINKKLMENENFGKQFSGQFLAAGSLFIKDEVESIKNGYTKPEEKMLAAFEFVKNHMKWDGYYGKYVTSTLRKAFKEKSGNVADINLLLTLMLKELDLDVAPVILSTRDHGIIHPAHPVVSKFNYVVASVNIDDETYLLDATDPLYPINMLPYKCLNGQGRIVSKEKSDWIDTDTHKPQKIISMYDLAMNEDGTLTGEFEFSKENYAALSIRKKIESAKSEEEFIEEKEKDNYGLKVDEYKFENLDDIYKPVKEEYSVTISDQAEVMGDMIYFTPILYDQIKENPFKLEQRNYPVDYGYTISETAIYKFTIPEGYEVEDKPQNITISLPEKAGRFSYNISEVGNMIQVMNTFDVNKTQFLPNEYQALKNFYNEIIAKHAEQIILKKKSE